MQKKEAEILAKRRLESYRHDSEIVAEWETSSSELAGHVDNMGIVGNKISDPTANVATSRLEPPKYIKDAELWVGIINDAWACLQTDDEDKGVAGSGKAYLMEQYYGLTAPNSAKYQDKTDEICNECCISQSTFNVWLRECVETVAWFAAKRIMD